MSNEITYHSAADAGLTVYAVLENTVGQLWNGSIFEAPVSGSWGTYDIALTEQATSTGIFRGDMPAAAAGTYSYIIRLQAGGSPAVDDIVLGSSSFFGWDGSAIVDLATIAADAARLTAARAGALTDWIDGERLDLLLDAIPTTAMRGTDGALTDKDGFTLSTAGVLAVWHQALTAVVTAGSVGKLIKDEITAARMAVLTDWINGGRLDLLLDAVKAVTDLLPNAGALTTIGTDTARLTAVRAAVLTDWIDAGRLDLILDAILADTADMQPKLGTPAANVSADIAAIKTETALIVVDTNELQTDDVPGLIAALNDPTAAAMADAVWDEAQADHVAVGSFGIIASEIASILVDTAEIGAAGIGLTNLGGMSIGMKAEVNVEALDVLNTDTFAEPSQGAPPATASLVQKIGYLFKNWRNKKTESNTEFDLYADDATTVDQKATTSDAAGVTTKGEMEGGP